MKIIRYLIVATIVFSINLPEAYAFIESKKIFISPIKTLRHDKSQAKTENILLCERRDFMSERKDFIGKRKDFIEKRKDFIGNRKDFIGRNGGRSESSRRGSNRGSGRRSSGR